jgi:hypothetical protein
MYICICRQWAQSAEKTVKKMPLSITAFEGVLVALEVEIEVVKMFSVG